MLISRKDLFGTAWSKYNLTELMEEWYQILLKEDPHEIMYTNEQEILATGT